MAKKKKEEDVVATKEPTPRERLQQAITELREKMPDVVAGFCDEAEIEAIINYAKTPFGIDNLDRLLNGGAPMGKVITLYGPKSSGKTTAAYHLIANYQMANPDKFVIIVDADNTADKNWMVQIGIVLERVILVPGSNDLESLGDYIIDLSKQMGDLIGMILVDAVGALVPRVEWAGKKATRGEDNNSSLADDNMAAAARKMGLLLRKINIIFAKNKISGVFIAHVYTDLSQTGGGRQIMKGGTALGHFSHVTLRFAQRNDESFKENVLCPDGEMRELRTGHFVEITIEKTRQSGTQYQQIQIPFKIGLGFDTLSALFNTGVGYNIIGKAGAWYSFGDTKLGCGTAKALETLKSNPEILLNLQAEISKAFAKVGLYGDQGIEAVEAKPVLVELPKDE